jgi:hypothetical protein
MPIASRCSGLPVPVALMIVLVSRREESQLRRGLGELLVEGGGLLLELLQ